MYKTLQSALLLGSVLLLCACEGGGSPAAGDPEKKSFDDVIAGSTLHEGVIDIYQDNESGDVFMRLEPDQLEKDYLYFASFIDGNAATNTSRGTFASKRVITLRRHFKKVLIQQHNTQFYFDESSALARAADANIPPTILASADILDENADGDILVDVTPVFLGEALQQIKPAADPEAPAGSTFALGELSPERTVISELRTYPANADIVVTYVYNNPAPLVEGSASITDSRFVTVVLQHTLLEAPENNYRARYEDPRIGYFSNRVTDMTSHSHTPWRDPINRWHLEKKDPAADLSEPVQPIVFWLENSTPIAHRDTIRDAVLSWNAAFESAGFRNAVVVNVQPDDADWDANDLRYNVLRWTSSEESPWGGYGPRWQDPRTGQILGANIMLEFGWITRHLHKGQVFADALLPESGKSPQPPSRHCVHGEYLKSQLMLGRTLATTEPGRVLRPRLLKQSLHDLVVHEVGHTLGLNHNFRGSQMLQPAELYDPAVTAERGVSASAMDYLAINFAPPDEEQADYYPVKPGPYDHWAIEYGYSMADPDPAAEHQRLQAILSRSSQADLGFGLDADVMTSSESGIDPRVMMFDQSSDPLRYASDRIRLVEHSAGKLLTSLSNPGNSWQELYNAHLTLSAELARQYVVISRWIGGIYVDRSFQGQPGATDPLQPVPLYIQKQAMTLLQEQLFAPGALASSARLYRHLQQQRRGQDAWNQPQDPSLHARFLNMQRPVLEHLLHPVVMTRISDSQLYGNQYSVHAMLADLTHGIFAADVATPVNSMRVQLQREYLEMLLAIIDPETGKLHNHISRAAALYNIKQIEKLMLNRLSGNAATRAHVVSLLHRIETGLEA